MSTKSRNILLFAALCVALCVMLGVWSDVASAQDTYGGGSTGLSSLQAKELDESRLATPLQRWIGIGSLVVALALWKFW